MEKILKREDGSRIKITVRIWSCNDKPSITVERCLPKKKAFSDVHNSNDRQWRALNMTDRAAAIRQKHLEFVTKEEINEVIKTELDDYYNKHSLK